MSFIYKYKTSTLTPFIKPGVILLPVQNIQKIAYVESDFTYNPGWTQKGYYLQDPHFKQQYTGLPQAVFRP